MSTTSCGLNTIPSYRETIPAVTSLFPIDKVVRYSAFIDTLIGEVFTNYISDKNYTFSQLSNKLVVDEVYNRAYILLRNILVWHNNGYNNTYEQDGETYSLDLPTGFNKESDKLSDEVLTDIHKMLGNGFESPEFKSISEYQKMTSNLFYAKIDNLNNLLLDEDAADENQDEEAGEDGESDTKKEYDKSANEDNPYDIIAKEEKTLFNFLIKKKYNEVTGELDVVKDANNLPVSAVGTNVFTLLISKINNIKDEIVLRDKLYNTELHKVVPELPQIIKILNLDNWDERTPEQLNLWVKLTNTFSQPAIPVITTKVTTEKTQETVDGITTEKTYQRRTKQSEFKGNANKILNKWKVNFNTADVRDELQKYIDRDFTDNTRLSDVNLFPEIKNIQNAIDFLETLGIKINTGVFSQRFKDSKYPVIIKEAKVLQKVITEFYNKNGKNVLDGGTRRSVYEPINALLSNFKGENLDRKLFKGVRDAINTLIAIEGQYSTEQPSMSARNAIKEMQYLIARESNISLAIYYLNNSRNIEELQKTSPFINAKNNPLFGASYIINQLYNADGSRNYNNYLTLELFSGENVGNKGKITRQFSDKQKIINDFNSMLISGYTDVMRLETSHSFYAITMMSKATVKGSSDKTNMPFKLNQFSYGLFKDVVVQTQFLKYLNSEITRIQSYNEKVKSLPSLTKEYKEFTIFSKLSPDLKAKLIATTEPITVEHPLFNEWRDEYEAVLVEKRKQWYALLAKNGVKEKDLITANIKDTYPFYEGNNQIANTKMLSNLFIMNTLVQNIEFSILHSGDPLFYEKIKDGKIVSEMAKRLKGLSSTGNYTNMSASANKLVNDSVYQKRYSLRGRMGVAPKADPTEMYTNVLNDIIGDTYPDFHPAYKNLGGKTTDGQGWMNPDTLHELSLRQGWANEYSNTVFMYESFVMKDKILKEKLSETETEIYNNLKQKIFAEPNLYNVSVMKASVFSALKNTEVDGKIFDKFSLAPLFPSFAVGHPKLEKMLTQMIKNKTDYVKYTSGTKGFKTQSIDRLTDNTKPDIFPKDMFKLQIAMNNVAKEETTIPTQLVKLIYTNQFDNGEAKSTKVKGMYDEYLSALSDIQKYQVSKLFKSLGITSNADGSLAAINYKVMSERLLKEAIRRGMNSNIISALKYNKDTKRFNASLEISSATEVERLITSVIDNTLRRFKVNGGDFVLISNAESNRLKFYTNENGIVTSAECRVTLTKEFSKLLNKIHPDGEVIGTLERLNDLMKTSWRDDNKKSLTIVSDRVPTQELNSMDSLFIKEFISPIMGNVIQVADEIVIKAGLDFDFDKEKVLFPSFNDEGDYLEYDKEISLEDIERDIAAAKEQKKSFVNTVNTEIKDKIAISQLEIRDLEDELDSIIADINSQREPENYIQYQKKKSTDFFTNAFSIDLSTLQNIQDEVTTELTEKLDALYQVYLDKEDTFRLAFGNENITNDEFDKYINTAPSENVRQLLNISKNIKDLYTHKKYYFQNHANRIVDNYSNALLLPERFDELTRPNSAAEIKALALKNEVITGVSPNLPTKDDNFFWTDQQNIFNIFFTSKNMLGPYAKVNTIQQLLAYAGTKINNRIAKYWTNSLTPTYTNINHILINQEEQKLIQEEQNILIGKNTDINKIPKQFFNSQSINATVDAANDPYFRSLLLTYQNVGVDVLFTSMFGYPKERVISFLSNVGLQKYANNLNNGMSKDEAKLEIVKRLNLGVLSNIIEEEISNDTYNELKKNAGIIFSGSVTLPNGNKKVKYKTHTLLNVKGLGYTLNKFLNDVDNNNYEETINKINLVSIINGQEYPINSIIDKTFIKPEDWDRLADPKNDIANLDVPKNITEKKAIAKDLFTEIRAYANFFNMTNVNFAIRDLSNYLSFDTKKIGGVADVQQWNNLRMKILDSQLITEEELIKLEKGTPIASFNNLAVVGNLLGKFMPFTTSNSDKLGGIIDLYNENYITKTKKAARILPNAIQNDFLYSIILNFGDKAKNGYKLITTPSNKETGYVNITTRLANFKKSNEYKGLIKIYPILEQLMADAHNTEGAMEGITRVLSIKMTKDISSSLPEQQSYIKQFRSLLTENIKTDPSIISDIFDAGLAKSGLQSSFDSFREFVPIEYYQDDYNKALTTFNSLDAADKLYYMEKFKTIFQVNNPTFFPDVIVYSKVTKNTAKGPRLKIEKSQEANTNNSSSKIKFYNISLEKVEEQVVIEKAKEVIEDKVKRTYTSKQAKSMTAKDLYKQINRLDEPTDARGQALAYLAGGGLISPESLFNDVLARRDSRLVPTKGQTKEEINSRDYIKKGGKTIKDISNSIWNGLEESIQDSVSTLDIENALIEAISENNTRFEAANVFLNEYTPIVDSSEYLDENPDDFKTDDFKCK